MSFFDKLNLLVIIAILLLICLVGIQLVTEYRFCRTQGFSYGSGDAYCHTADSISNLRLNCSTFSCSWGEPIKIIEVGK